MKNFILAVLFMVPFGITAQHTFSIVAVDAATGEIGSAGATCLFFKDAALEISDIVLGVGAINTQAWWVPANQAAARQRMEAGDSPQEILLWLQSNDNGSQGGNIMDRQYGIVDLRNGEARSGAFTGNNNFDEKGHRTGSDYAIQGNILISQAVLDDMENAYLSTNGPLCDKLMAVLQAAKRPGADVRCLDESLSSGSAFIRVAKPTDTSSAYGDLWLDLSYDATSGNVTTDPIDVLQMQFDEFKLALNTDHIPANSIDLFPNPTTGQVQIKAILGDWEKLAVKDLLGRVLKTERFAGETHTLDLQDLQSGLYFIEMYRADQKRLTKKLMLAK